MPCPYGRDSHTRLLLQFLTMHQRKRADWPLSVYQYWIRLEHPSWLRLPEAAKQETEGMRTLWNHLVDAFERRQSAYRALLAPVLHTADRQETRKTLRPALQQLQQSFTAEVQRLTANCSATWANREFILQQFLTATDRFFKHQSGPPRHKLGPPREIHFHHRFTSGGVPIARIFGRSHRLHLEPVPPEAFNPAVSQHQRKRLARTQGSFQVRDTTLSFVTILHRPLPQDAYLKTAALIGKQVGQEGYHQHQDGSHSIPARWDWSLHLTLEIPPPSLLAQEQEGVVAALELSARIWHDGRVRIGVLTDSAGREEALFLPDKVLHAWQHKRALQSKADQLLEETKNHLRQLQCPDPCSPAARSLLDHLGTARAPGLWRLLQLLEATGSNGEVLGVLQHWADSSTRLLREARGLERGYLRHRDWFYHNLALQLCRRYQQLVVTTNFQGRATNGQTESGMPSQEAATYRHLTSLSRFLLCLQQAATKIGTEIKKGYHFTAVAEVASPQDLFPDPVQRGQS